MSDLVKPFFPSNTPPFKMGTSKKPRRGKERRRGSVEEKVLQTQHHRLWFKEPLMKVTPCPR
jgi:hypothetical protein